MQKVSDDVIAASKSKSRGEIIGPRAVPVQDSDHFCLLRNLGQASLVDT